MVDEKDLYKMVLETNDSKSLEILYDRYESLLFNLAYKITQDVQSSAEVLQDVFMKIWNKKAIEDFQGIQTDSLPEYDLLSKEVSEEINKRISFLNKDQQKIISLFYYKGLSQQEIASKLNIPLGTVKSRMRLSIQHLNNYFKKALRREDEENER